MGFRAIVKGQVENNGKKPIAVMSARRYKIEPVEVSEPVEDLKSLREEYERLHPEGKKVSPRYLNDGKWLSDKIEEFKLLKNDSI